MLYKKKEDAELSPALFANPTCEYRATPFWAWNDRLEKEELLRQIGEMREMGYGGFHMHSRSGMATPYLSEEFGELIRACTEEAERRGMLAWLYDEDRWPSGAAGGIVTKNPRYRQKYLRFSVKRMEDAEPSLYTQGKGDPTHVLAEGSHAPDTGAPYLLAVFSVELNPDGTLAHYRMIQPEEDCIGTRWYVYAITSETSGWYNNQAYLDTLSEEAVAEFARVTYGFYEKTVGDAFGKTVPAIFTDEPQFRRMGTLPFAESRDDIELPWTTDLPASFASAYGFDLIPHLPELLWDLAEGKPSRVRYLYHDHVCERFTRAFSDQCGAWCRAHGIALTGHMMEEHSLYAQSSMLGEAMRAYRSFGLPGIDMLCNRVELCTAKQAQSAVHQYGREGMLSELYGVSGWDFDFRGHKFQGDWQAALGVTVRVPHLAWYSMKGSAKRDYPASLHYQSAWYRDYPLVEDHFARLNTVLTRGKPCVRVAVVHPVESYWLHYGPGSNTADRRTELERRFDNVMQWLLRGTVDFDFISESLLPSQHRKAADGRLHVGEMAYDAVILPGMETVRSTTLQILTDFADRGGKLIFMGDCPPCVDAEYSEAAKPLYARSRKVQFSAPSLLSAVEEEREVEIRDQSGESANRYVYNKRLDGESEWLFLARIDPPATQGDCTQADRLQIRLRGRKAPEIYDTLTGSVRPVAYEIREGDTYIRVSLYAHDSLLLRLRAAGEEDRGSAAVPEKAERPARVLDCKEKVVCRRSEPNVLVLDMPEWSEDGVRYEGREEMLRIDRLLRGRYGFPPASGRGAQPWVIHEEKIEHYPFLRFRFASEIDTDGAMLGYEALEELYLNGKRLPIESVGYFTDRHIYTTPLPGIRRGPNELLVRMPFGRRQSLENLFVLGDFDVRAAGCEAWIEKKSDRIAFGSVCDQGLPFYGASLSYDIPFTCPDCDLAVTASRYKGALIRVQLDGRDVGQIVFSPYRLRIPDVAAGTHTLTLTVPFSRINCFGGLHNCADIRWIGPDYWYTSGDCWAYEYQLRGNGILKSPWIEIYEKGK